MPDPGARQHRRWLWLALGVWVAAMVVALLTLDGPVARACAPLVQPIKKAWWTEIVKSPGTFGFTVAVGLIAWWLHELRWRALVLLCASSAIAGLIYSALKWPVGRIRPIKFIDPLHFEPFRGGWEGLIRLENAAFPSGHASVAFATAAATAWLFPRTRVVCFVVAAMVGIERIAEQAHYVSDVIAAIGLGIGSAWLARTYVLPRLKKTVPVSLPVNV